MTTRLAVIGRDRMNDIFALTVGGQPKRKTIAPQTVNVRRMTLDEIKELKAGDHPNVIANDGTLRTVKINGQVRRWKREPDRVEVPVKYGLYEYATFSTTEALTRFVVVL